MTSKKHRGKLHGEKPLRWVDSCDTTFLQLIDD